MILVVFALPEEAAPFKRHLKEPPFAGNKLQCLVGGMGANRTRNKVLPEIERLGPKLVITCGFAGGLAPELSTGQLVFSASPGDPASASLLQSGARPARFHLANQVASTVESKRALRSSTGADVVEMESGIIQQFCEARKIRCLILRVISDPADESFPLDFSKLVRPDATLDPLKLALAIARNPGCIPSLLGLKKRLDASAKKLAEALMQLLKAEMGAGANRP